MPPASTSTSHAGSVPKGASVLARSSSLDPQETSEQRDGLDFTGQYTLPRGDFQLRSILPFEASFRHSGWEQDRRRVFDAMNQTQTTAATMDRFANCGGNCVIEYSPTAQIYRLRANYCHCRWCQPCSTARSRRLARQCVLKSAGTVIRFVTLTLRHNHTKLSDQLQRLWSCFKQLRRRPGWLNSIDGGIAFCEVKLSTNDGCWHCHLHILTTGKFMDQKTLAREWYAVTGDSYVVDIRRVSSLPEAVGYVTKYAGKPCDAKVIRNATKLEEAMLALKGTRAFTKFGTWYGLDEWPDDDIATDWTVVAPLTDVWSAKLRGDGEALKIWEQLFAFAAPEATSSPPAPQDSS